MHMCSFLGARSKRPTLTAEDAEERKAFRLSWQPKEFIGSMTIATFNFSSLHFLCVLRVLRVLCGERVLKLTLAKPLS